MTTRLLVLALVGALAAAFLGASADATSSGWQEAIEVAGDLNTTGFASVSSVSCGSPTVCVAAGAYENNFAFKPFVVTETNGHWGVATEVPGTANLMSGAAGLTSISCPAAGACSAGGRYTDSSGYSHPFVVEESRGRWGDAFELAGPATVGNGYDVGVTSLSCGAPGECVAAGNYTGGLGRPRVFVAVETHGHWGEAIRVRGTTRLSQGPIGVSSVSCAAAGECEVGGHYTDGNGERQAFLASLTNGHWRWAVEVPGTADLNRPKEGLGEAEVSSVSCDATGVCAATGYFASRSNYFRAFVVSKTHGRWKRAIEVPTAVSGKAAAQGTVVSCAEGVCVAGGWFSDLSSDRRGFVVNSRHGRWGHPLEVFGGGYQTEVTSISCGAAGVCAAGGHFGNGSPYGYSRAWVVSESHGYWSHAIEVPGTAAFTVGDSEVTAISCAGPRTCALGGRYDDINGVQQAFVTARP